MSLRIVSVLYNNRDTLIDFLDSLERHIEFTSEIVLWDNANDSKYVDEYLKNHPQFPHKIILKGHEGNLGFSKAANKAAQLKSSIEPNGILFLNPDGFLASPITKKIFDEMLKLNALIGLRVFNDATKNFRQASARNFPGSLTALFGREGYLSRLWPQNPWSRKFLNSDIDPNKIQKVDWVSGCALFCPASLWKTLNGFDENYFLYVEDVDLGRKAQEQNIPVIYFPKIDVVHTIKGSSEGHSLWPDIYHHQGMWKFYLKWAGPKKYICAPFVALGIIFRFCLRRFI